VNNGGSIEASSCEVGCALYARLSAVNNGGSIEASSILATSSSSPLIIRRE